MESLAGHPQVHELIQGVVDAVNAERSRYEQIKRFAILPRDFTMDDDELTPTLKLKRRVVSEHFGGELEELYAGDTLNQAAGIDPPSAEPGGGVPGVGEARDLDDVSRVRRVDELAAADVDARRGRAR